MQDKNFPCQSLGRGDFTLQAGFMNVLFKMSWVFAHQVRFVVREKVKNERRIGENFVEQIKLSVLELGTQRRKRSH